MPALRQILWRKFTLHYNGVVTNGLRTLWRRSRSESFKLQCSCTTCVTCSCKCTCAMSFCDYVRCANRVNCGQLPAEPYPLCS